MKQLTAADLKPLPSLYESSRNEWDVLIGDDDALPLIKASSSGEDEALKGLLKQARWVKIALKQQHCIYHADGAKKSESDVRKVLAMPMSNLTRAMVMASEKGHAACVSTLLTFAPQHGVKPSSLITGWAVDSAVENGYTAVIEAMAIANPTVVNFHLHHGVFALDRAIQTRQADVVAVLLQHGADVNIGGPEQGDLGDYNDSRLSLAARKNDCRVIELLLRHGATVNLSGALHCAAESGALDAMRILLEHGADVDEILPSGDADLRASWTPMHFAAKACQVDAMELLKEYRAREDIRDANERTPEVLLREQIS